MVRDSKERPALRMWFSAGTDEDPSDRDKNGVIDMVQDTTDLIDELKQKGYQDGVDYRYVQIEGGTHDQATWAGVLPDFLQWAFPPP
jgi:enterochelin esterase-like enzyme